MILCSRPTRVDDDGLMQLTSIGKLNAYSGREHVKNMYEC